MLRLRSRGTYPGDRSKTILRHGYRCMKGDRPLKSVVETRGNVVLGNNEVNGFLISV